MKHFPTALPDRWTRRAFLQAGMAAGALPFAPRLLRAGEPAAKPALPTAKTFLFLDWFHVKKGDLAPALDPARISAEGRKMLEGMARDSGKNYDQSGHGLRPVDVPSGIRIQQEVAQKSAPWLRADQPWERGVAGATVLFDEGRFRCWYTARLVGQPADLTVDRGRAMEVSGTALAYAESDDGLLWKKPALGILSHGGSRENNLVTGFHNGGSVFRDDHGPAEERYKLFQFDALPTDEVEKNAPNQKRYGLYGVTSPDGYSWTRHDRPLLRYFSDTFNIGAWDPLLQKYVGYFRHHLSGRTISRAETEDFWHWPEAQPLLYAGPLDKPADDYYTNGYTIYPGQPSLRLLFSAIYHRDSDAVDVRLGVSRDGRAYSWISYDPIIQLGQAGDWDRGSIYASTNLVMLPDGRLALPYTAYNTTHNEAWFRTFYGDYDVQSGVGWATWPDGRLAGIVADEAGRFTTNAARFDGTQIQINARTLPEGSIEMELHERGKVLAGFSFADAIPFSGDATWANCRWRGQTDLTALRGKNLELSLRLRHAKIFAGRFV
ncbi:MAG: hypothetical protein ABIQ12_03390 [Opitutaceae bacterium]